MSEKKQPRQSRSRTYFKVFSERMLFGSTRSELLPDERGVWFDFLSLASLNYGEVECFSRDQLSSQLLIDRELLDRSIEKFIKTKKIRRNYKKRGKKEIFPILKWDEHQADCLKKPSKKSSTYKEKERVIKPEESDTDKSPKGEEIKLY